MSGIITSLIPVFLVIALGFSIRRLDFPGDDFWPLVDRVTYFVLFPALLFHTLVSANLRDLTVSPMAFALLGGLFTMVAVLTILYAGFKQPLGLDGRAYSSVFQGSVRWNGFVAIASIDALFGEPGVTLAAIAIAVLVPTVNVLSVLILTRHAGDTPAALTQVLRLLSRNPLILACAAGIALQLIGVVLPAALLNTADILGRAALTLGLLSVGAGLQLRHAATVKAAVTLTTTLKLVAMPLFMALWCWVFGVEGLPRTVVILCGAVPGATSSYVLARQLGGDTTLMATLITASTLGAILTMPLVLLLLG